MKSSKPHLFFCINWLCRGSFIWAHCDTNFKILQMQSIKWISVKHCKKYAKHTTLYCTFTCLQTSTSRIADHLHCKIWLIWYCNVFSCITWIMPSIHYLILPFHNLCPAKDSFGPKAFKWQPNLLKRWYTHSSSEETWGNPNGLPQCICHYCRFLCISIYLPLSSGQFGLVRSDEIYCCAEKNT